ncbi:9668_t:CDS:2 [Funneliformis geosporum]|uniref:Uridylate kinase n=1 Tax=Funneliformis geosporum TaxID=1117311 RepID=A0A9W4SCQ5_9GLOM|nr:11719_t:CDS:2 [Funneliformis geosporum]CAI2168778.1 9668_t:CDS:2 [Funneliformis geosporum]
MQRTVTDSFKLFQGLKVSFHRSTRAFSVSPINNHEVKVKRQKVKPSQAQNTKGPHPLAILAVLSVGVSAYVTLVKSRGGPGSGKGTQCAKIVQDFGFIHLSAGDLLRKEQERPNSPDGELITKYIKEGKIVPMEITIGLLEKAMIENDSNRFLIDGFPRQLDQAHAFEKEVVEATCILFFDCPEEVMLKRLLKRGETSGRSDDNRETIKKRFKTFIESSYPVVEYYRTLGKVHTIPCTEGVDEVYAKVKPILNEVLKQK